VSLPVGTGFDTDHSRLFPPSVVNAGALGGKQ
jgi:hypothetical protein